MGLIIKEITDPSFSGYGRVLPFDLQQFLAVMDERPAVPEGTVSYEPSLDELEELPLCQLMQQQVFGGMPVEFGHCSGWNQQLDALEYHCSSEVDIAATDLVLMLGRRQDICPETLCYDTSRVECFHIPRGTAVELYATTLHYAPCSRPGLEFRMGVVLPGGTNLELGRLDATAGKDRLLQAKNKWLLVHPDSGLTGPVWYGLRGANLRLD